MGTEELEGRVTNAEAQEAGAAAAVAKREGELAALEEQDAAAKRDLAHIEALETVNREDLVVVENTKRRLRRLGIQRQKAADALEAAQGELEVARHATTVARREVFAQRVQVDADQVLAELQALSPVLTERLTKHQQLAAEAKGAGVVPASPWADLDPADPWTVIGEVLRAIAKAEFDASPAEVARRAEVEREQLQRDQDWNRRQAAAMRRHIAGGYGTALPEEPDPEEEAARVAGARHSGRKRDAAAERLARDGLRWNSNGRV
jgi:hypothetical protein